MWMFFEFREDEEEDIIPDEEEEDIEDHRFIHS